MEGFIKIHRKILDWQWFRDGNTLKLFLYILLNANYEDKMWNGILIKRGELATSIEHLSNGTGLTYQQIRTCLKRLEATGEIFKKSTNKHTLIAVRKYNDYQDINNKPITNKEQTNNKQITTTKEYKEIKKERNNTFSQINQEKFYLIENKYEDIDSVYEN
jgi:biotin operon repressor